MLLTPGDWHLTDTIDVRHTSGDDFSHTPQSVTVHVGTAATAARCRPFDDAHARLSLDRPLPLQIGDRVLLRTSGRRTVLAGALVLDPDPPSLKRRGEGARRADALAQTSPEGDLIGEVRRRGAVRSEALRRIGVEVPEDLPEQVRRLDGWLVEAAQAARWSETLRAAVEQHMRRDPLSEGLSQGAAADLLDLPEPKVLAPSWRRLGSTSQPGASR
ncbi:hypothetical protein [Nesterenkonia pannonica]|uniref:hypothetical protein n=1 Tax=Nesterenkonia pannonica TaxID=1548602 RepID=UPI002164496A|nr:hypothetical protein [Nesterenkonia pannonica]